LLREAITASLFTLQKRHYFFQKVGSKKGRGAARSGGISTSLERSDETATIGLCYIVFTYSLPMH
jgi:hypothetical protein